MAENTKIEELSDQVKEYINTRQELIELKAADKISVIASEALTGVILALAAFLFILMGSMTLAYYIAALMGDAYFMGFLVITGFYLLVALVVLLGGKQLIGKPFRNKMIHKMFGGK